MSQSTIETSLMNTKIYALFAGIILLGFLSCKKEKITPPEEENPPVGKIEYLVKAPAEKLPWPQHNPDFDQQEFQLMQDRLFILNNFGQYQSGDAPHETYLHAALDIILANGTPIYAIDSGYVRSNIGGNEFYRSLIVEDKNNPGQAWGYTHINEFKVTPGDFVQQGQLLGVVNFQGLEHIHLSRFHRLGTGSWTSYDSFEEVMPDDFFFFEDKSPPVIETPFLFFEDYSNTLFDNEGITRVDGKVDIVVGMRDVGSQANGTPPGGSGNYGNRLTIRKITYRIKKEDIVLREKASFDFGRLRIPPTTDKADQALLVFKFHGLFYPDGVPNGWNRFISHYIITNVDEQHQEQLPESDQLYWETNEVDENGQLIFPNGTYTIEVSATDSKGNETVVSDQVEVMN